MNGRRYQRKRSFKRGVVTLLALVMLVSVCFPAFRVSAESVDDVEKTETNTVTGTADTLGSGENSGEDAASGDPATSGDNTPAGDDDTDAGDNTTTSDTTDTGNNTVAGDTNGAGENVATGDTSDTDDNTLTSDSTNTGDTTTSGDTITDADNDTTTGDAAGDAGDNTTAGDTTDSTIEGGTNNSTECPGDETCTIEGCTNHTPVCPGDDTCTIDGCPNHIVISSQDAASFSAAAASTSAAESGLTFNKTVTARGYGTYDLNLTLQGIVGTEETPTKMDVVIIIDRSRSMIVNAAGENRLNQAKAAAKKLISTVESNSAVDAIYKIVDFAGSGHSQTIDDATAGEVVDGKVNVVRISEWYDSKEVADGEATGRINSITVREDIYANDTFTYTNAKGESVTKTGFYYNHRATNYEAVFRQVNTIDNYRNNTMKVIVFLTDGDPTCAWTKIESDDTSDGKGYIDGYWNSEGYGTTNETTNNIKKCLAAAKDEIGALKADRFYMVGIGEAKRLSTVNNYATQVPYKKVINTNSSSLESEFEKIGTTLNELFYKNITITDTLSHEDGKLMVKITDPNTIGITVKNGSKVVAQSAAGVKTVTIPETPRNSQAELTASYDEATDQLKLDFPDSYKLEPNYTYILSAVIEPTEKAYREYRAASESYTDTPDSGTGTHATNNENGFFSNDSAVVNYAYGDQTGLHVNYKYPVVRLTPGNLVVTKEITGLTEDQIKALDLKFDVTITYPDDESVDSTETVSRQLTLSDMTPKDGVYSYTFTGLSPNTEYTVTESGGAVDGYTMTTKVNGTAANEEKSATGTVGKGATVTVAYENDYTVAVTNVTVEKQVTGNMGDSDKPFTFKASLKDASMVGLEFVQYSKNESGELSKGTKMTIGEADLNADGLFEFTLKDDEYITFSKVPMKGTLIISEDRGVYTLTDVIVTNIPEGYEDNLMKTQNGMELFVTGEHKITFNNHYSVSVDTGFSFDSYPFILMLSTAIVAAFVLLMGKLRYRREF